MLAGIVSQEAAPPAARVSAAIHLLDRGWGKPPQTHTGQDGDGAIRVVIRHIVEGRDGDPVTIEHVPVDAAPIDAGDQ